MPFFLNLCYLKCGNLFGRSCATKCLNSNPRCPACNVDCTKELIRNIYAVKIHIATDTRIHDLKAETTDKEIASNGRSIFLRE